jgi:hypothetical protein
MPCHHLPSFSYAGVCANNEDAKFDTNSTFSNKSKLIPAIGTIELSVKSQR